MKQMIFDYLESKGIIDSIRSEHGTISLTVSDNDIVIAGNRLELITLADYILNVALADFDGWHLQLDELNLFDKAEKGLVVELKLSTDS